MKGQTRVLGLFPSFLFCYESHLNNSTFTTRNSRMKSYKDLKVYLLLRRVTTLLVIPKKLRKEPHGTVSAFKEAGL